MKLLFLAKRHPQGRDLIERPYGRFHHLPRLLAARGHDVGLVLCSHRNLPSMQDSMDGVARSSLDIRTLGIRRFMHELEERTRAFSPDWVVGCSDAWYGWLASRLADKTGAHLAVDAYDNFEAYMPWNFPLHQVWRRAIRRADLVTAAGPQLATRLQSHRRSGLPAEVLPMAADPEFRPLARRESRRTLGLDDDAKYVGYVGSWSASRGSSLLIDAFRVARAARPDLQLLLSGKPPGHVLSEPGVTSVGYLPDAQLPLLLNAIDVACVVSANTEFGRFSYPAKLCEAMACGVPVVATATAPVDWMLGGNTVHLVPPGDPAAFADRMLDQLIAPRVTYSAPEGWPGIAADLEGLFTVASRGRSKLE